MKLGFLFFFTPFFLLLLHFLYTFDKKSNMYQEIIVAIIGISVALLVAYKIYKFFTSKNEQKGSCGCSNCGCNPKQRQVKY